MAPPPLAKLAVSLICAGIIAPFLLVPVLGLALAALGWPLALGLGAYLLFIFFVDTSRPENPGGAAPLRKLPLWRWFAAYFPVTLVDQTGGGLDPKRSYLVTGHPHGVCAFSHFVCWCTEGVKEVVQCFPGLTCYGTVLQSHFLTPFHREFMLWLRIRSCSRRSLINMLHGQPGNAVFLLPGGAAEALMAQPGTMDLLLQRRLGFCRVALESGACLVPVLSFGETDAYDITTPAPGSLMARVQAAMLRSTGFGFPVFLGAGFVFSKGLLPKPVPITVVVGPPLLVTRYEGPTSDPAFAAAVTQLHGRYVAALQSLYDANKDKYAAGRVRDLRLVG